MSASRSWSPAAFAAAVDASTATIERAIAAHADLLRQRHVGLDGRAVRPPVAREDPLALLGRALA